MKLTKLAALLTAILLCVLPGCHSAAPPAQQEPSAAPWDVRAAEEYLRSTESCVVDLIYNQSAPYDMDALERYFFECYGQEGPDILWTFFDPHALDESGAPLFLEEGVFYPTIYHAGIEITAAQVETRDFTSSGGPMQTFRVIVEEYVGEESALEGFSRANFYVEDGYGNWVFHHLEGSISISGEGVGYNMLPLKDGLPETPGPGPDPGAYEEKIAGAPLGPDSKELV